MKLSCTPYAWCGNCTWHPPTVYWEGMAAHGGARAAAVWRRAGGGRWGWRRGLRRFPVPTAATWTASVGPAGAPGLAGLRAASTQASRAVGRRSGRCQLIGCRYRRGRGARATFKRLSCCGRAAVARCSLWGRSRRLPRSRPSPPTPRIAGTPPIPPPAPAAMQTCLAAQQRPFVGRQTAARSFRRLAINGGWRGSGGVGGVGFWAPLQRPWALPAVLHVRSVQCDWPANCGSACGCSGGAPRPAAVRCRHPAAWARSLAASAWQPSQMCSLRDTVQ